VSTSTRLAGVDGLRALAALWVVLFHMSALTHATFPLVPGLDLFMRSGSTGVSLFLVLSGFCLYLPFAGGRTARFRTGEFFRRRCRRLLPAYYVALGLAFMLTLLATGPLGLEPLTPSDAAWQLSTHVALVQTMFPTTFYALNGAFWSLGLEWQLYLTLPLLVWGVARFGLLRTVAAVVACNVVYRLGLGLSIDFGSLEAGAPLATAVLPNQLPGRWAEFAFGLVAAEMYASGRLRSWSRYTWRMVAAILVLVPISILASRLELSHILYGGVFVTLLCVVLLGDNPIARALAWRPLVIVGTMSYSLYLVHQPFVQLGAVLLQTSHPDWSPATNFFILLLSAPAIFFVAWLLFVIVERRSLAPNVADVLVPRLFRTLPVRSAAPAR
jgi:peptidoglycan/LPS O-acetylase OafA/YrhL